MPARKLQTCSHNTRLSTGGKLQPLIAEILDLSEANTYIILGVTYASVAMVVLNAMLMSVF